MTRGQAVRGILRRLQTAWGIVGVTLLLWGFAEVVSDRLVRAMYAAHARQFEPGFPDASPEWVEQFATEMSDTVAALEIDASASRWQPFVYWRSAPYEGQHVRVDPLGRRRTVSAAASHAAAARATAPDSGTSRSAAADGEAEDRAVATRAVRILTLGGSTMWGVGARDEKTIPSLLAAELASSGIEADVVNLAQIGYVSSQEVISLLRELQRGARPDVVVFLDGYNDVAAGLVAGEAGVSIFEHARRAEYNTTKRSTWSLLGFTLRHSALAKLTRLMRGLDAVSLRQVPREASLDEVAADVLNCYAANVAAVEALGQRFGFAPLFYWQPVIYEKRKLSPGEVPLAAGREAQARFCRAVYHSVRRHDADEPPPEEGRISERLHYLGDIFNHEPWDDRTAFLDRCHLTEAAGAAIARRMADDVRGTLVGRRE